jgi:hypothetical protein
MKAGIDVLLFVIPFLCLVLRVFFNSPTQSYLVRKDVFFQQSQILNSTHESRDWGCAALCIPFFMFGLEYFSTVPPLPMKAGLSDVLLFGFLSYVC